MEFKLGNKVPVVNTTGTNYIRNKLLRMKGQKKSEEINYTYDNKL